MKLKEKEILKEILTNYLVENKLCIKWQSGYTGSRYSIENIKVGETVHLHSIDNYLFTSKFNEIANKQSLMKFIQHLLKKDENICLDWLGQLYPNSENEAQDFSTSLLPIIEKNKKHYLNFVLRKKYLEKNMDKIGHMFTILDSQEHREMIIDKCLELPALKTMTNQTVIYNLIQKNIRNKKKYENSFDKILKVDEDINFIENSEALKMIKISINVKKINSAFIDIGWTESGIKHILVNIGQNIAANNKSEKLTFMNKEQADSTEIMILSFIGKNPNENLIKEMLHVCIKNIFNSHNKSWTNKENFDELLTIANHNYMKNNLAINCKKEPNTSQGSKIKI